MQTITLSVLTDILSSVPALNDFKRPRAFWDRVIFTNERESRLGFDDIPNAMSCMYIDAGVISNFAHGELGHHLSSAKLTFIVTKLIILFRSGEFAEIENDIAALIAPLSTDEKKRLTLGFIKLQREGKLPLLQEYEIKSENLPKVILACFTHCCYFNDKNLRKVQNSYVKGNISVLYDCGITQEQFTKDFPLYKFKTSWDELLSDRCLNCEQCRTKCPPFDSNYNVERLLNLYLNTPSKQRRDIDHDELENMLYAFISSAVDLMKLLPEEKQQNLLNDALKRLKNSRRDNEK